MWTLLSRIWANEVQLDGHMSIRCKWLTDMKRFAFIIMQIWESNLLVYYWVHDCLWVCLVAIVCLSIERTYTARLKIYNKQYHDQTILVFDQYMPRHISLFTLISGFFFPQFCQVAGLVIIQRRNEPKLTRCHQQSEFCFWIPFCSINLHELIVQIRQLLTFSLQNIKAFAYFSPKKPFV